MKKLLQFLFALAFLSLLSPSAFAQWGSTIKVSNDAEYLDAMQNTSVQNIIFERGYYASIGREMQNDDMMLKNKPSGDAPQSPLSPCVYATQKIIPQCWNEFSTDRIDLLAIADATGGGLCNPPDAIGWQLFSAMSAEIGGVAVANPVIVQGTPYTVGAINYYPATATGFVNGGVYYFTFGFSDGTLLMSPFRIWRLPSVNLGADFTACISSLSMSLSANSPIAAYSGLPAPQQNGVLSYLWSVTPATATITNPTSATPTFSASTPGVYTVQLAVTENVATYSYGSPPTTVPAHTCTDVDSYKITVSSVTALVTTQTNASCFGGTNGTATVTPSGGTLPYTYSWNTSPIQTTSTATNLAAGVYTVTVKDATQCSATATVTITQPVAMVATISAQTNVLCFANSTGAATVNVTGGTGAYTYSWNTSPVKTTASVTGLAAGTYIVTVKDANLCTTTASVTISQPAAVLAATITAQTNISCTANSTGSATVGATGGTGPYTYSWNTTPVKTTATATNLAAGTYVVTVTDANQCTTTATAIITQPTGSLSASISAHTNVLCYGNATGSATVTATSGTAPYTYSWNTSPVKTTATATGLAAGIYTVTVTDANLCTTTASVTITQPSVRLAGSITAQTNVSCATNSTGSATVAATGGTSPYTYSWNTTPVKTTPTATNLVAGTYIVTITDANLCTTTVSVTITQPAGSLATTISAQTNVLCYGNATGAATVTATGGTSPYTYSWNTSPVRTTATISNLVAGTYVVTVTDANLCTSIATVIITQPAGLLSAPVTSQTNVLCYGNATGAASITATAGTGPYTYSWNTTPVQTTATATGLVAGVYTVTVKDANLCTAITTVTITQPAAPLAASITAQTNVSCTSNSTGSATVTATGGTGAYTYSWNTTPVKTTPTASNLAAGTYVVTVTDANLCVKTVSVTITQPAGTLVATISAQTNVLCYGNATGSATVTATGGTSPYTYSWNTSPVKTTATISNLVAGTYVVTVTDANLCTAVATAIITQQADFQVTCHGNITVCSIAPPFLLSSLGGFTPAGGVFTENGIAITTFNPLVVGVHTITYTYTNDKGCSKSCTSLITVDAMGLATLEGQVKYFNPTETYMQTPFPTDIYGTTPPDYFYVALYDATANTPGTMVDWQKVDITQTEKEVPPGSGNFVIDKDYMSYFKFNVPLDPAKQYQIRVWDGSNMYQEFKNLGTATGNVYNPQLGSAYTWNNWGGVTGIDALGMQYMINGATQINAAPTNWNWIGDKSITSPSDLNYGFYSNSIANVNSTNNITALDALTTQYRIAGLQPTFPNMVPNFRVSGRFVETLPKITFPRAFTSHNFPIDVDFVKSTANYTYFTKAIDNYYVSSKFTSRPFYITQNPNSPIGDCPDFGYINIYYTATGDVNASYVPPSDGFKAADASITLAYENEVLVQKGEIVDFPVSVDRSADLGSIVLGLTFRKDLIKVIEVPGYDVVNIDNEKGIVRVVWADVNGKTVNSDVPFATIKALVLADITTDTHMFALETITELGGVNAKAIENVNLKTVAVTTKLSPNTKMFISNYPNPSVSKTTFSYYLPEAGNVKLTVFNRLGSEVATVVNKYESEGTHLIDFNRMNLAPGVYYYRLVLNGTKDTYSVTRNMVLIK